MVKSAQHRPGTTKGIRYAASAMLAVVAVALLFWGPNTQAAAQKPPPAPAAPQALNMNYGFFMAVTGNNTAVKNMGFQWVQYGVYWSEAEPTEGNYFWGHVDNIVNSSRDAGLNVLIRISRTPTWARDPDCSGVDTCPPDDATDLGRFSAALAARVRSLTPYGVAYEIWNEPNTSDEWGGNTMCPEPARYTDLLKAAYPAIKSADSSAQVLGGAVTTVGQRARPQVCAMDDLTFLEEMYNAGARPYFDILAVHPYGFAEPPEAPPTGGANRLVFRRAERHRDIMVQYGDAAKKVWATEMGWAVDPHSEGKCTSQTFPWYFVHTPEQQADYMVRAFQWSRSYWPWMTGMFIFNFDFNDASWYTECQDFRFLSVKGRAAQSALAAFVQNPPPTYTPVVGTPTPLPDLPPQIVAVRYSATAFARFGGTLTVEVDATDADSSPIDTVQANVTFPGGAYQVFDFQLVSGNAQQGTWRATIPIEANGTASVQQYTIAPYAIETYPGRRTAVAPVQTITVHETRFIDVPTSFWAYEFIEGLAERGAISGYGDGSFRPGNSTTRAQLTKITMLGFGYPLVNDNQETFADVPAGSPFHAYVETAARRSIIGGYPCGRPSEPCDAQNRPYFRPNNSITRGQITKIVVLSAGWPELTDRPQTFNDVAPGSPFFGFVESAAAHQIIGGYPCGSTNEPCDSARRPYFRPNDTTTRAQIAKMVYLALQQSATATPTATGTSVPTSIQATPATKSQPRP
ncbi:MAG: S-layer homology domain-containing protein [Chloroflexota bacterium]|nr:S-layer homology domain-containing protein [Chloroflexota bacterium]